MILQFNLPIVPTITNGKTNPPAEYKKEPNAGPKDIIMLTRVYLTEYCT